MQRYRRAALVAAAYLGTFLASLDISIVNVALPTLQTALATDMAGLQWVVNAYALCLSACMLSAGPLGDRHGHKRIWLLGVALFTAGSLLCALAASLPLLLAGRAVQGVAGALLIPGAMPILSHAFPDPRERAHVIGGWSAFSALALILGPLLGGMLLEATGWQSIFLINLPLGVLAMLLGAWGITERHYREQAALDRAGQVLSIVWLGALTYGLIALGEAGGAAAWASLGVALLAFLAFLAVEARAPRPLLPLRLFRDRAFASINLASLVLGFACYSSLFFFSLYLQQIQGWPAGASGWRMLPQFAAMGVVSMCFGRLSRHVSLRRLMLGGYVLAGLVLLATAMLAPRTPYAIVGSLFGLLGLAMGLAVPATGLLAMASVGGERAAMASAIMNALRQAGMTLGVAVLGSVMSLRAAALLERAGQVAALAGGFQLAMLLAGLACLAVAVPLYRLPPK
ncbi:MFS transporter [Janthinobacterium sp. 1_2014MBL_MicDiv]|uniref:MFS transporter n=1 Tax=Janthinobacterium sp. 1_2014MBL_MicDiv TaxID=1644131 RepID=UPI0008F48C27|nr:MFS transporter [Janthinobacterium sp. 1_2014MBL_MicDiv]APA71445.1 DSBA oxidoreductase [Janthinobacterium sp. 1_2014MBL_MicDiv]